LFNYGGALTVTGLPTTGGAAGNQITGVGAGFNSLVTLLPNQVNLLVLADGIGPVQTWDGPGPADNATADGGSGNWDNFTANWTGVAGVDPNAAWQNGTAVFGAPNGTVTITDTVNAQGLIFGTSGYVIDGGTLNLVGQNPAAPGVPFISVTNAGDTATINAQITNSVDGFPVYTNGLTSTGAGTLILANAGNTYTGGTTITGGGTISISGDGNLGAAPGAFGVNDLNLDNGALQATATFTLNANRQVVLAAAGGGIDVTGAETLTIGGANQITGAGGLTKFGTGTLVLSGTNDFTGATLVSDGNLTLQNGAALEDNNAVTVNTPGVLQIDNAETIGSLAGSGGVTLNDTLTTGGNDTNTTFSGGISGSGGLT
ncbi:MAG TPA: autotransporter-associated beta strand repeat-containing protein, partial [Verrucomicrobiae bacterium]|nr:autotransporter-associated beta strand repeat-containing protein [Verrucomicrobiae bacterium]